MTGLELKEADPRSWFERPTSWSLIGASVNRCRDVRCHLDILKIYFVYFVYLHTCISLILFCGGAQTSTPHWTVVYPVLGEWVCGSVVLNAGGCPSRLPFPASFPVK